MLTKYAINVYSEIGRLRTVLLHRPGEELSNLTPDLLKRLLFDDTPDLLVAQAEHDSFAKVFSDNGVEVLYIEKLVVETISQNDRYREELIGSFLKESGAKDKYISIVKKFLEEMNNEDMVNKMISGISKYELNINDDDPYPLIVDPLPNILFQRDPFASIGNGVSINRMSSITRRRETLFSDIVLRYHKRFKGKVNFWYDRDEEYNIEGGDILVLNSKVLIVGVSQRTSMCAVRKLSKKIIKSSDNFYEKVVVFVLKTKSRAFMHLDTLFTNVDYDKFIVHPLVFECMDQLRIIEITDHGECEIKETIINYLSNILGKKIKLIKCGGDNPITQSKEQWNDGTNVIVIAPGEVIAYSRNYITVKLLREAGIKVHEIVCSELSRGRGGPRCMSMPIWRENL